MPEASRVLIVEAESFYRDAIRGVLCDAGFACETASNGAEALGQIEDDDFEAAILGMTLPDDGELELLKRLRADHRHLPVIAVASHAEQERVLAALRLGAFDYLAKPIHDEELTLAVRRAVEYRATAAAAERVRERLRTLETRLAALVELARRSREEEGASALRSGLADAVADVLKATKTSLMLLDDSGHLLRVAAATGRKLAVEEFDPVPVGEGPAGRALSESILVREAEAEDGARSRHPGERYASRSFAIAPLAAGARKLGVLCAADPAGGTSFDEEDGALLRILALQAAWLLESGGGGTPEAAVEVPAGGSDPDAELARSVCDAVTAEVEPTRLLEAALRPVAQALSAAPVSLYLLDPASGDLLREGQCDGELRPDRPRIARGGGLTGTVLETGRLVASAEPAADPRFDAEIDTPEDGRAGPLLCIPLRFRGKVLGVFRAFPPEGSDVSARTGEVLAAALSAAVRNVLLYRSLVETIEEVARARREAKEVAS
ncbi:MAG: GAF domain-containing protein [Deltaproteobacteria bacterium]|nr:MAG: GAF domain-containing protein [Deltaproteobacteria bacterium]